MSTSTNSRKPRTAYKYAKKPMNPLNPVASSSSVKKSATPLDSSAPARSIVPANAPRSSARVPIKASIRRDREQLLEKFANWYNLPTDSYISDVDRNLAKIMVKYESSDPLADQWRGAIFDYTKNTLVKTGRRVRVVKVGDDETLSGALAIAGVKPDEVKDIRPFLGGALLSIFKYQGVVYFSSGRSLGMDKSAHPGALDLKARFLERMTENFVDQLFDEYVDTYTTVYNFILLDKETLDVTRANVSLGSVIYVGLSRLSLSEGSGRSVDVVSDFSLGASDFYPSEPQFYIQKEGLTEENAEKWFSGEVTGFKEELVVELVNGSSVRLQPESAHERHVVRGDVATLLVRLTQLLADYEYDAETLTLTGTSPDQSPIVLPGKPGDALLVALREKFKVSLPLSRSDDVDAAFSSLGRLSKSLTVFFQGKNNPSHPASVYWDKFHLLRPHELASAIWTMTADDLFYSLRWYKLV